MRTRDHQDFKRSNLHKNNNPIGNSPSVKRQNHLILAAIAAYIYHHHFSLYLIILFFFVIISRFMLPHYTRFSLTLNFKFLCCVRTVIIHNWTSSSYVDVNVKIHSLWELFGVQLQCVFLSHTYLFITAIIIIIIVT